MFNKNVRLHFRLHTQIKTNLRKIFSIYIIDIYWPDQIDDSCDV